MNCSSRKKTMISKGFTKLKGDFDLDDKTVSKAFLKLKTVSSETLKFIRSFQFKFLDDIIYTNARLAKIGYVPKGTCTFCEVDSKTILHLFYERPFTNLCRNKTENTIVEFSFLFFFFVGRGISVFCI